MKRVLVTGASGFIGKYALEPLKRLGYEVHCVSSKARPGWYTADLLNECETSTLIRVVKPTHLLHFAWYVEHGQFWQSPANFRWVQASLHLLREFHLNGGTRVVMAGTCAEDLSPTPYGVCKAAMRDMLSAFPINSAWGRVFFLYGPDEPSSKAFGSVVDNISACREAPCSSGEQIMDFLHVEDVASAFVAILDSNVRGAIDIGSGAPTRLQDFLLTVADTLQRRDLLRLGAIASKETPPIIADTTRLFREVAWQPSFALRDGIRNAVESRISKELREE